MQALADAWSEILWAYYLPSIRSGSPFYLAADDALIHSLGSADEDISGLQVPPLESFAFACQSLMTRLPRRVLVADEAFKVVPGMPHSRVICLAVQQVLVVERMLRDKEFSEHAYFPRYRELLGVEGGLVHSNPLEGQTFRRIWEILGNEIKAVSGSSPRTVTFSPGGGPETNRRQPLSQALLTTHDLELIRIKAPQISAGSEDARMRGTLVSIRKEMPRRAQSLINLASLTSHEDLFRRICSQVRAYLASPVRQSILATRRGSRSFSSVSLVAYLDQSDFMQEVFLFSVRDLVEDPNSEQLLAAIDQKLIAKGRIVFAAREGAYVEADRNNPLALEEGVMVVIPARDRATFRETVGRLGGSFDFVGSNLPSSLTAALCSELTSASLLSYLAEGTATEKVDQLRFIGGLLADARSSTYLLGYAPIALLFRGERLSADQAVKANGENTTVGQLLEFLRDVREPLGVAIEYLDSRLQIALSEFKKSEDVPDEYGYSIADHKLTPACGTLKSSQAALRGYALVNQALPSESTQGLHPAILFGLIRGGRLRVAVAPETADAVIDLVEKSGSRVEIVDAISSRLRSGMIQVNAPAFAFLRGLESTASGTGPKLGAR